MKTQLCEYGVVQRRYEGESSTRFEFAVDGTVVFWLQTTNEHGLSRVLGYLAREGWTLSAVLTENSIIMERSL